MKRETTQIIGVFSKHLAFGARKMSHDGKLEIIELRDFPKGAPIHEDGSTEYDPKKPLVIFAVHLRNETEIKEWDKFVKEWDETK